MEPRVLIDAAAVAADRGALARYIDGLIVALDRRGADIAVACQRPDEERYARLAPSARILPGPTEITHRSARLAWEQSGVPVLAGQVGAHVIHGPYYTVPVSSGLPTVVTVHDVTWFDDHEDVARGEYFRSAIRSSVRRATRVLVPSKATRDELVRVVSADPTRIDVAYHGVDHSLFHRPTAIEIDRVSARLGLHGHPYIAFLGALQRRKNVPSLIRGFAQAVTELANPPVLVLAGSGPGVRSHGEVDAALREVPAGVRVLRPGYLPFTDLPGFLGGAMIVAVPSLGEGFGLPVLEAMACGAPVLTTRRASLPEVGGDAVAYCPPDAGSIGAALLELIDSSSRRASLGEAGFLRSQDFTWDASAEAHMLCYRRAVE